MQTMYSTIFFVLFLLSFNSVHLEAQLQYGYYSSSCGFAQYIVKDEVRKAYMNNARVAAGLLRLHFHDCFVNGCDGSVLIDSTDGNAAEKDSPPNKNSLQGFEVIDNAKERLEAVCPGIVSCADIVAFAARDSVEMAGGFVYDVPGGRKDGRMSRSDDALQNLPPFFADVDLLTKIFATKGLNQEEMVVLSGAHTIGAAHCTSFNQRLYNFSPNSNQDPSLDPAFASQLACLCPPGNSGNNPLVPTDPISPLRFDEGYYRDILAHRGLFQSDQTLLSDPATAEKVTQYANYPNDWQRKFADAMVKMGQIDVITGDEGEIRINCRHYGNLYLLQLNVASNLNLLQLISSIATNLILPQLIYLL